MIAVTYRIRAEEPLLATSLEGDPNSAISFSYIPGSLIRGVVAGLLPQGDLDLAKNQRPLIFDGSVRFLNAYPGLENERERRLPTPLSWKQKKADAKDDKKPVWDLALLSYQDVKELGPTTDVSGFTRDSADDPNRYTPQRRIAVHTLRDRKAGRATQVLGAVYRHDAIASGEEFVGAVVTETHSQAQQIEAILKSGVHVLGGAQGGGYGKVTISDVRIYLNWQEISSSNARTQLGIAAGDQFRITLLSDAILRRADGATTTDITQALPFHAKLKLKVGFCKTTFVGGFNRKWGLPLPQEQAVLAGSVFVLKAIDNISAADVQSLLVRGIGERRAEGFGRIAIDWGAQKTFVSIDAHASRTPKRLGDLKFAPDSARMAERMQERLLRRSLDKDLAKAINATKVSGKISNSQLARLRIIARSALEQARSAPKGTASLDRLVTLFEGGDEGLRPTALKKYSGVRVNGTRLPTWITNLAKRPETGWDTLTNYQIRPLLPDEQIDAKSNQSLALEYTVRLIDGVLASKMKASKKGGTE
jgi:CRISPR-associated protein Csx10